MEKTWVDQFHENGNHNFFIRVNPEFLGDESVKNSLRCHFPEIDMLVDYICGRIERNDPHIDRMATRLYYAVHSYYLETDEGLEKVYSMFLSKKFPLCPRYLCKGTQCLPTGAVSENNVYVLKLYCPRCKETYNVSDSLEACVPGDSFGENWIRLFLAKYPEAFNGNRDDNIVPRIFGFKIRNESILVNDSQRFK